MQFPSMLFRSNRIAAESNVQCSVTSHFYGIPCKANKSFATSAPSFTVSALEPSTDDDSTPNNLSLLRNSCCWLLLAEVQERDNL